MHQSQKQSGFVGSKRWIGNELFKGGASNRGWFLLDWHVSTSTVLITSQWSHYLILIMT